MLTNLAPRIYEHQEGDSYAVDVTTTGSADLGPAVLCGGVITFPANVTPAKYALCTPNYQMNIAVRSLAADGMATVTVSDTSGKVVDTFDVSAPSTTPKTIEIALRYLRA